MADPGDVGAHPGEDRGPLWGVAAPPVHKAGHSLDIPPPVPPLAAERPSRVPLERKTKNVRHLEPKLSFEITS